MALFTYNYRSPLNEDGVRYVNYVLVIIALVCGFYTKGWFSLAGVLCIFVPSLVLAIAITEFAAKKEESVIPAKADTYKYRYLVVALIFSFLLALSIFILWKCGFAWPYWIPVALFALNLLSIPTLYSWLFEDCLDI